MNSRTFNVFNGVEELVVTLNPGDVLLFNHNVWHRGTPNSEDSTCMFLYLDTSPYTRPGIGWSFHGFDPDDYSKFALMVPEGSRHFVYKEARSLYEVPTFINSAWRDPAFLSNIVGGGK